MALFFNIIIVLVIISAMVMVLLAITQLSRSENFDDRDETNHLRHEIREDRNVVSKNNIFHNLVEMENKEEKEKFN